MALCSLTTVALACAGITEPEPVQISPTIVTLGFEQFAPQPGFALELDARVERGTIVAEHEFLPVTFTASSGGEVTGQMFVPRICELDGGTRYHCNRMLLLFVAGHGREELQPLLDQLDAAYRQFSQVAALLYASVQLFSGDIEVAIARLTDHPAVGFAQVKGMPTATQPRVGPSIDPLEIEFPVTGFVRTVPLGNPVPPGALAVESGTQVTARYVQPDGTTIEAVIEIR